MLPWNMSRIAKMTFHNMKNDFMGIVDIGSGEVCLFDDSHYIGSTAGVLGLAGIRRGSAP